jgi:D-3-phosphoglycerate dehydrogenase
VILLNTSRGLIVETKSLVSHLKSGSVIGAALDVLEYEDASFERLSGQFPDEMKYLMGSGNVILTPHIAGWTEESKVKLAEILAEKIIAAFPENK